MKPFTRLRIVICLLLLFAAGAFAGSSITRTSARRNLTSERSKFKNAEDQWLQRLHDQYAAELDMTPEQIAQAQPAMEQARSQFRKTREEAAQQTRHTMGELYRSVQKTLTPEQQKKFSQLVKQRRGLKKSDGAPAF